MDLEEKKLNLLSLDGGGIRGLSSLYVLKDMMEAIDPNSPPKPCEVFDMIGGTSAGGLIAIMLGRLKMDVDQCIDAYVRLSRQAFTRKNYIPVTLRGNFRARFNTKKLEQALKTVVVEQGLDEDALLQDPDTSCRVFVCTTKKITGNVTCFTSFHDMFGEYDLYKVLKIWEAGRATSAAPSFFDPFVVYDPLWGYKRVFLDGALGANNAVRQMWLHAGDLWGLENLKSRLGCLVSLGTGMRSEMSFTGGFIQELKLRKRILTDTEFEAETFAYEHYDLVEEHRYFRFNVSNALGDIGLGEVKKMNKIISETRRYLINDDVRQEIAFCASSLQQRQV
ncbi:calcium-independent phospholipase A2-gamma [Aspergillus udagawae]|nr:calcium-independent phospholipase A2-gamma [Aspergillus udagawae]